MQKNIIRSSDKAAKLSTKVWPRRFFEIMDSSLYIPRGGWKSADKDIKSKVIEAGSISEFAAIAVSAVSAVIPTKK